MRIQSILTLLSLCLAFSGCTQKGISYHPSPDRPTQSVQTDGFPVPLKRPIAQPQSKPPTLGPAETLYSKAKKHIASGNYNQAEIAMERALRIEPRNGYYWYTLAQIKYHKRQFGQSIQLSLKSKSMAGVDQRLSDLNDTLMRQARKQ